MGFSLLMFSDAQSGTLGILVQKSSALVQGLEEGTWDKSEQQAASIKRSLNLVCQKVQLWLNYSLKKKICLGFTLKDLGCSFCTHVFGKWLLGVVYDKLWISNNFPEPSSFSFSWSFSYFLIFMFTFEKIKPEGRMPFLKE